MLSHLLWPARENCEMRDWKNLHTPATDLKEHFRPSRFHINTIKKPSKVVSDKDTRKSNCFENTLAFSPRVSCYSILPYPLTTLELICSPLLIYQNLHLSVIYHTFTILVLLVLLYTTVASYHVHTFTSLWCPFSPCLPYPTVPFWNFLCLA